MWEELGSIFEQVNQDGDIRAVVLASNLPKFWTAGIDLVSALDEQLHSPAHDVARKGVPLRQHILDFQNCITSIEKARQPVIAAVHGIALGLAVDILCACDIRYAASNATFSIKEVDVGMAADIGTLSRLPKIMGSESAVRELALTAREFDATEANQLGFVSKVVQGGRQQVIDAAVELAKVIASKSPVATFGTKHLLLHARDSSVKDSLEYTATWNSLMLQSKDTADAFAAFKTRKPPVFKAMPKL
ncbi:hypothetical protein FRB99_008609 [Tulasnella sp. 403]|nr:hypothetical protein FRB99_008609 [Tulasnella sp. 403]